MVHCSLFKTARSQALLIVLFLALYSIPYTLYPAFAQTKGIEVTQTYPIADTDVLEGDIVSNTAEGIIKSKVPYDSRVLGIIQNNPLVVFRSDAAGQLPVVYQGTAYVNVTNLNGNISKGDFITTSAIAGKGQKSLASGYAIGTALETFSATESATISFNGQTYVQGQIPVALRIEYASLTGTRFPTQFLDQLLSGLLNGLGSQEQLTQFTKYLVALIIFLASLIFAFLTFAKVITKGIEGLGRNPLARTSIQLSIIINAVLVVFTLILGLAAAVLIIRL
jgi:hypothetical protein